MAPLLEVFSMISAQTLRVCREGNRIPLFRIMLCALGYARLNDPEHSSGPISSLLVASDVADDIGHVLIALFFVGDEGGVVVIIVLDRLVDFDVVFRFRDDRLDLAGVLFG